MMACWLAFSAFAAPPDGLRPVVARAAAPADYRAWLAANGRPEVDLECLPVWPGVASLCFRVWEPVPGDSVRRARRWVSRSDADAWDADASRLRDACRGDALVRVAQANRRSVVGLPGEYLEIIDADGASAAGLLAPEALVERLGGAPIAVGLPSDNVLLAWRLGDPQVDLAMAVGVHEVFVGAETPITEVIHRWDGAGWSAWAMPLPADATP